MDYLRDEWARSSSAPIALSTYEGSREADVQALQINTTELMYLDIYRNGFIKNTYKIKYPYNAWQITKQQKIHN